MSVADSYARQTNLFPSFEIFGELPGVDVKRLQVCPHMNQKSAAKLSNIRIKKIRDKMYFSYTMVVTRDITNDIEVEAILTRCAASEALDTCERMRPLTIKHFCKFFKMDKMPWSSFLNSLKPAISCPIKKGTYVLKDAEISTGNYERLPLISGFYKFEFIMRDMVTKDLLICVYSEALLNP
ncbi:unnamed protein product [Callosobruchus maculatus]|uniref:MD-2-related lipid-recognition domain-containing protein n=1 Tax=Callosobruchus maculatus TaxID=64391 RepID=A0A653CK04_CALMS|nr:unnamed protein product [Callosobruchus maculatus]